MIADCTQQGDFPAALALLDRALALAPWLEHLHRHIMLMLAHQGHFSAALKQYELCRRLLSDELSAQPSYELESLHPLAGDLLRLAAPRRRGPSPAP